MDPTDYQIQIQLIRSADRLSEFIRRRIPASLRSVISPDDLLQEVWVAAHRRLPRDLVGNEDAMFRWLLVVSRRKLVNAAAREYSKKRGGDFRRVIDDYPHSSCAEFLARFADQNGRTPSSEGASLEAAREVRAALAKLPHDQLRVVCMRHFEGRTHSEIASRLGRSRSAINSLLHRGINNLRSELGDANRFFSGVWPVSDSCECSAPDPCEGSDDVPQHRHDDRKAG
jgi:RNA polymerase sigma-70 factor, ECF subfamily